jgi:hypothetical protein
MDMKTERLAVRRRELELSKNPLGAKVLDNGPDFEPNMGGGWAVLDPSLAVKKNLALSEEKRFTVPGNENSEYLMQRKQRLERKNLSGETSMRGLMSDRPDSFSSKLNSEFSGPYSSKTLKSDGHDSFSFSRNLKSDHPDSFSKQLRFESDNAERSSQRFEQLSEFHRKKKKTSTARTQDSGAE